MNASNPAADPARIDSVPVDAGDSSAAFEQSETIRWLAHRKLDVVLACLPHERYGHILEPGCTDGAVAAALAPRGARLTACHIGPSDMRLAQQRNANFAHVEIRKVGLTDPWPDERFDLIVIHELGCHLGEAALAGLCARIERALGPQGVLLACHPRQRPPGARSSAERVHRTLATVPNLHHLVAHAETGFLVDVWSRDRRSVAQLGGLA